jgi:5-methyltetrahydrofolate--homocysteine methyltransferase
MNPRSTLLRSTLARRPLLADGAMGTQLQQLGLAPGAGGELWNVDHPDRVRQVHRSYVTAGADLLTTNSFGGTSYVLATHEAGARVR